MARAARVLRPVCPRWHQTRAHRPRDSGRDSVRACACRSTLARWVNAERLLVGGSWNARAQSLALVLFVALIWLLIADARKQSRRVFLALPLLVVWANV